MAFRWRDDDGPLIVVSTKQTDPRMYMEEIVSNDLKENLKVFWSYVKSKRQESTGVSPLKKQKLPSFIATCTAAQKWRS